MLINFSENSNLDTKAKREIENITNTKNLTIFQNNGIDDQSKYR